MSQIHISSLQNQYQKDTAAESNFTELYGLTGTALQPGDNISALNNDSGYITSNDLPTVNDGTLTIQKNGTNVATFTANSSSAVTANITVPTTTSELANDSNYLASGDNISKLTNDSGYITSSSLPTVNNKTLTIQKNGTSVATFTANSSSDVTANITVPTTTSELANNSGYITSNDLPTVNNGTLTIQKNGTSVASFTANQSGNITANITVPTKTSDITNDSGYLTSSALISYLPLSGGTMSGPLVITGGDSGTAGKIILNNANSGQITNNGTSTLFGFTSANTTNLTVGHGSYALTTRGSATRPTYNGNNLALYNDIKTTFVAGDTFTLGAATVTNGFITTGSTLISFTIPTNYITYTSRTYKANTLICAFRRVSSGYIQFNYNDLTNLVSASGYTVALHGTNTYAIEVDVTKSSAWVNYNTTTATTNNVPVAILTKSFTMTVS